LSYTHIGDDGLSHICKHSTLIEELKLSHYNKHTDVNITNAGMVFIATHLKNLRILECYVLDFDAKGLESLVALAPTLQVLSLNGMKKINKDAMVHIGKLTNLKILGIIEGDVDDKGIEHIAGLSVLEELNLKDNNKITDASMKIIGNSFPHLRKLNLFSVGITDNGLGFLSSLKELQELILAGFRKIKFTDQGVKQLFPLADTLIKLDIGDNPFTDDSVQVFTHFKKLAFLGILNTKITSKGTQEIAKHLQGCKIE